MVGAVRDLYDLVPHGCGGRGGLYVQECQQKSAGGMLGFAAGAMIYVVVEELIPESQLEQGTHIATMGAMIGFAVMMPLDVALG